MDHEENSSGLTTGLNTKLKGKRSGLDLVKNGFVVMFLQRCPNTHLKNEYAANSLKFRDLTLCLFVAREVEIISKCAERNGHENILQKILNHSERFDWKMNSIVIYHDTCILTVTYSDSQTPYSHIP